MTVHALHARRIRRRIGHARAPRWSWLERAGRLVARSARARAWAGGDTLLLGRCVGGAVLVAFLLASATHGVRALAALPLGGWIGWRGGRAFHERAGRAEQAGVAKALPVLLGRLTACVLAGMSIERALRLVAPGTPGLLGIAMGGGLRALDLGVPRARAYELIAARAGSDDVRRLMAALARAERFGTPVAHALQAHADDVRSRARAAAEAEARTAPVKLIFPLVFCFLPAFVMLTIAPIAIGAVRTLSRM